MRVLFAISLVFSGLFILGCNKGPTDFKKSKSLLKGKIVVIDSIILKPDSVPYLNFFFDRYSDGYFISSDQNGQVYLLDTAGNLRSPVGKKGKGPGEYQRPVGLYAAAIDSIFVAEFYSGKILLYDSDGSFMESWDVVRDDPFNTFATFNNFLSVSSDENKKLVIEYLGRSDRNNNISSPKYYQEARLVTIFKSESNSYKHIVPFEEGSPYRGNQYFLSPLDPRVTKSKDDQYAVVFPHEDAIYLYSSDGDLIRRIDGRSDFFPAAKGVSFDKRDSEFGRDYVKYNVKQNAINYLSVHFFESGDSLTLISKQYEAPVRDASLPDDLNTLKFLFYERDSYLQFFSIDGSKIFADIKQPRALRELVYAESLDFLIFKSEPKLAERNILYVAKIIF